MIVAGGCTQATYAKCTEALTFDKTKAPYFPKAPTCSDKDVTWPEGYDFTDAQLVIATIRANPAVASFIDCVCKSVCAEFQEFKDSDPVKSGACAVAAMSTQCTACEAYNWPATWGDDAQTSLALVKSNYDTAVAVDCRCKAACVQDQDELCAAAALVEKKDSSCSDETSKTCASMAARGASDFKESFDDKVFCSTCSAQPSDCAEWIRNISPKGCFAGCASGLLRTAIEDYYVMYKCTDQEKTLVAKTLNLGETWYEKVGDSGLCTADSAGKEFIGDVRGNVASRQECMDLCTGRSECIGITGGTARDCELEARDCDALVVSGCGCCCCCCC